MTHSRLQRYSCARFDGLGGYGNIDSHDQSASGYIKVDVKVFKDIAVASSHKSNFSSTVLWYASSLSFMESGLSIEFSQVDSI